MENTSDPIAAEKEAVEQIITSRARILRGDWTMHRPPNLPPDVRSGGGPAPRSIDYNLAALLARD